MQLDGVYDIRTDVNVYGACGRTYGGCAATYGTAAHEYTSAWWVAGDIASVVGQCCTKDLWARSTVCT